MEMWGVAPDLSAPIQDSIMGLESSAEEKVFCVEPVDFLGCPQVKKDGPAHPRQCILAS